MPKKIIYRGEHEDIEPAEGTLRTMYEWFHI